jgi:hypothetical protein
MSPAEAEFLKIKTIKFSDIFLAWFLWTQPVHVVVVAEAALLPELHYPQTVKPTTGSVGLANRYSA